MNIWRAVWVLWACFLVRGVFYCALLPLWEGWDEWSHFAYLECLAGSGHLPRPYESRPSRQIMESLRLGPIAPTLREFAQNAPTHDIYWQLSPAERETLRRRLLTMPETWQDEPSFGTPAIYEAQQPPLYYLLLSPFSVLTSAASLPVRVFVVRLISIVLASASLPLGFLLLRSALATSALSLGSVALVAVMPVFAINTGRVGNEGVAVVFYALLLILVFRLFEGRLDRWWGLKAGVVLGCGLLTKAYFLTAIPALILVCAWAVWEKRLELKVAATQAGVAFAIAAGSSGWWYSYIRSATGTFSGQIQAAAARQASFADYVRALPNVNWRQAIDTVVMSYVWFGAASFLRVRSWMYHFFGYALVMALVGLFLLLAKRRPAKVEQWWARVSVPVLGCFLGCFLMSMSYHVVVTYLLVRESMTNGWYLYALVFAEVGVIAIGIMSLMPPAVRRWVLPIGSVCFGLLDLYGTNFVLVPYYHGLIRHSENGLLQAFHLSTLGSIGWDELLLRFGWNRPFLGRPEVFVILWVLYVAATLSAVVIAFAAARNLTHSAEPRVRGSYPPNSRSNRHG